MHRILLVFLGLLIGSAAQAQQFGLPPIVLELEPVLNTNTPGLHSFAFAKSGSKWMFVGGRTNGMHGLNVNGGFPLDDANQNIVVIDTSNWNTYYSTVNTLPFTVADPLRSTNMQYHQEGDYLYMTGGYGWDSIQGWNVTFPILTAIHVDSMIDAVMNGTAIAPHIRQVMDSTMMVCGGEMEWLDGYYYVFGGHDFAGRYDDEQPSFLFTQTYANGFSRFQIDDDGTNLNIVNFSFHEDTAQFHRRDLSTETVVKPNGDFGLACYGGVFRRDYDLPFLSPILVESDASYTVRFDMEQQFNHYTTATVPVFDSVSQKMHTVFLGGTSLYFFNDTTNQVEIDSLVPFIDDISTMSLWPDGSIHEYLMPVEMPSLLGTNAKFVLNEDVPHYENGVIKIRELQGKTCVGYMFGGIRALKGNGGNSFASDTIYRVCITPDFSLGDGETAVEEEYLNIFPNPAQDRVTIQYQVSGTQQAQLSIYDLQGRQVYHKQSIPGKQGLFRQNLDVSSYAPGLYVCELNVGGKVKSVKFSVLR